MIPNKRKKGFFIVCEGVDGAGKTTTIDGFLKRKNDEKHYFYSKGLKSDTFIGRIALSHPSTLLFLLELVYVTHKLVKPSLRENKIVLQDRYDFSILAYTPACEKWYNKLAAFLLRPYLIKPDLLVYFDVSLEERIKRLKSSQQNKHHAALIRNPELVYAQEKKFAELLNQYAGRKAYIDTTNKSIDAIVNEFAQKITGYL